MGLDILFLGLSVAAITIARRWRNGDRNAGIGVAGWGTAGLFIYVVAKHVAA